MDEAIAEYREAIRLKPDYAEAHNNLGAALQALRRTDESVAAYQEAVRLKPDYATAWNNLGSALQQQGNLSNAIDAYHRALSLDPNYALAHYNLANALREQHRAAEAIDAFRAAVRLKPDFVEAHSNLGAILHHQERLEESLASYETALRLRPDWGSAAAQVVHLLRQLCRWDELEPRAAALREAIVTDSPLAKGIPPFSMLAADTTPAEQLRCARQWASYKNLRALDDRRTRRAQGPDEAARGLRIGYLSADFRPHATAYLIAGMLESHDHGTFHITAYDYGPPDASPMRERLRSAVSSFVEIDRLTDRAAAKRIRDDGIDILVDLKGYTQHARTAILAYRPAPIQTQFLGYPGTMGTRIVDYLIADRFVVPESHLAHYAERVVHLPNCYQPNDPKRAIGVTPSRREAGLPDRGFVFCSFNETWKIAPVMFDLWMKLLKAVPGSVLWLLASNRWAAANLQREAERRGVNAERLIFAPRVALPDHLGRIVLADLVLDTLPYNAHTTASDALWSGVPVLTCPGETFASRVAGSLLITMGLTELIAASLDEYEQKALELATSPERLTALRARVLECRRTSPLFDAERFTRNLEAVFRMMWQQGL